MSEEQQKARKEKLAEIGERISNLVAGEGLNTEETMITLGALMTQLCVRVGQSNRERRLLWFHFIRTGQTMLDHTLGKIEKD